MKNGGVKLAVNNNTEGLIDRFGGYVCNEIRALAPEKCKLIECKKSGDAVVSKWEITGQGQTAVVEYSFRLWQKSLIVDVHSAGGKIGEVSLGNVEGAANTKLLQVPYWTGEDIGQTQGRPAVVVAGTKEQPLFMSVFLDHYRTGSSRFYFSNKADGRTACAGGSFYIPKTSGERNDCYERIFLTFSPRFEEVLPEIPNPPSEWRQAASEYVVVHQGASSNRNRDYEHWKLCVRYGMKNLLVMDHEDGWRDGGESFTFRTISAPGKGGDEGQETFARKMQQLGIRYGLYNNYTDLVPVNAFWDEDLVTLLPDGSWETAWYRCYAPKSQKTVSMEPVITAKIQEKFHGNTACLDVHTAITPWMRVDYDERVPGAGTMLSQFYDFGQLMLHQQKIWNGPVFSEGGSHFYYCGLVTGNQADDRGYDLSEQPWLVDFDLLKMHPLGSDFGFAVDKSLRGDAQWDRFFAGTIAYGHIGRFSNYYDGLVRTPEGSYYKAGSGMESLALRSYYMLQQLQSSYGKALAEEIRYADENGALADVSSAVASGSYSRSQLRIKYNNGLVVWVNGNKDNHWTIPDAELPPNGYFAKDAKGELVVFSGLIGEKRADYVHSPAYDYVDGRGQWIKTPWAAADGQLIVLKNPAKNELEVIPFKTKHFALALKKQPASITALDINSKELGRAGGSFKDGMFYIDEVPNAVSYMIKL
jgi:hypothetical protein